MLKVELDEIEGIALLELNDELSESDFTAVAAVIDPYIEREGELKGIIIHVESFPGWDSFSAFIAHLKFVKGHHKKVSRIAFATDSPVGNFAETVASHFVNAEVKHFEYSELEESRTWILG